MATKTNIGLVEYAKAQLGLPYWYGTYGQTANSSLYGAKKKQYPKYYTANDFWKQYGKRVHDCIGLIKGYLWSDSPTAKPKYKASQDTNAGGMFSKCKEKGAIGTMPELPGVLVFFTGHVGVYIGNGYVIEARGHSYGVVKTALKDRPWKNWGKCPWITYEESKKEEPKKTAATKKSVEQIAKEVIKGLWGNGASRVLKLTKAGYNAVSVQKKVNELLKKSKLKSIDEIAREVINGKWGNGQARVTALKKAGYDYNAVQRRVNELLS